jgi:hypothetical protein
VYTRSFFRCINSNLNKEAENAPAWKHLERKLGAFPACWMMWESEPLPATMDGLDDPAISTVICDRCANFPASGDFMTLMGANAAAFEEIAGAASEG